MLFFVGMLFFVEQKAAGFGKSFGDNRREHEVSTKLGRF